MIDRADNLQRVLPPSFPISGLTLVAVPSDVSVRAIASKSAGEDLEQMLYAWSCSIPSLPQHAVLLSP